jgi:hypothetical protein
MWEKLEDFFSTLYSWRSSYLRWRLSTALDQMQRERKQYQENPELEDKKWVRKRTERINSLQRKLHYS